VVGRGGDSPEKWGYISDLQAKFNEEGRRSFLAHGPGIEESTVKCKIKGLRSGGKLGERRREERDC
jgi:hypothetical protein